MRPVCQIQQKVFSISQTASLCCGNQAIQQYHNRSRSISTCSQLNQITKTTGAEYLYEKKSPWLKSLIKKLGWKFLYKGVRCQGFSQIITVTWCLLAGLYLGGGKGSHPSSFIYLFHCRPDSDRILDPALPLGPLLLERLHFTCLINIVEAIFNNQSDLEKKSQGGDELK